ncbi:hypothetical protein EDC04DRAFT_1990717 [Pisolithus marmoratus]|nr:hypothetical protein EDC04DRAFT_1990717 [Pisolithus marmoratus]
MNGAGPSRPRNRYSTVSNRPQSAYEDDLLRMLANLDPDDIDQYQEYHERRHRRGRRMSDYDVAMSMFLEDAKNLETLEEDRTVACALARDPDLEDEVATPVVEGTTPRRTNFPRMRTLGRRFVSLLKTWAHTPLIPTTPPPPIPDIRTQFVDPNSEHLVVITTISHALLTSFNLPRVTKACTLLAAAGKTSHFPKSSLTSRVLS